MAAPPRSWCRSCWSPSMRTGPRPERSAAGPKSFGPLKLGQRQRNASPDRLAIVGRSVDRLRLFRLHQQQQCRLRQYPCQFRPFQLCRSGRGQLSVPADRNLLLGRLNDSARFDHHDPPSRKPDHRAVIEAARPNSGARSGHHRPARKVSTARSNARGLSTLEECDALGMTTRRTSLSAVSSPSRMWWNDARDRSPPSAASAL